MALFSALKEQFRSVIEWNDTDPLDLVHIWSLNGDEIKNASTLIVNPGQGCIFVYKGSIRAIIQTPGSYPIATGNIPFLTTLSRIMQMFESEMKVGFYFFKTTCILDQKWGTTSPIKYLDPVYSFPVGLQAFGNCSYCIKDVRALFLTVIGTVNMFSVNDMRSILIDRLVQPITAYLAKARYSYADIDGHRLEIAQAIFTDLTNEFATLGLELSDFRIEGTNFDDATMKRINRIADMSADVQAAKETGLSYSDVQRLEALRDAARNESGAAGAGVALGAGIGLGNTMASQSHQENAHSPTAEDPSIRLQKLQNLHIKKLITDSEYETKRQEILNSL